MFYARSIGASAGATEEETHMALKNVMENLFADDMKEVYPFLGHLLGVKLEEDMAARVKYLDGPALQAKGRSGIQTLFAEKRGVIAAYHCLRRHSLGRPVSSVELLSQVTPSSPKRRSCLPLSRAPTRIRRAGN